MDATPYLSPQVQVVLSMVSRKVRILENGPLCRKHDIFGFFDAPKRELTLCSHRIVSYGSPYRHFNETILHESVHVAQACRVGFRYLSPFGLKSGAMPLSAEKAADLARTVAFDARLKNIDREAFSMEDKPRSVQYVLHRYCL